MPRAAAVREDEDPGLIIALEAAVGLRPAVARWLARSFPASRVREKLAYLPHLPEPPQNPAGWLVRAIEHDWQPPLRAQASGAPSRDAPAGRGAQRRPAGASGAESPSSRPARAARDHDPDRYLRGPWGHLVKH